MRAYDHETLTVTSGVAVALTNSKYNTSAPTGAAAYARIFVEGEVRYWEDGTNPTPTGGILLEDGDELVTRDSGVMANLRFIAVSATSALQVEYGR